MALVTEVRRCSDKKLRVLAAVRIMTGKTHSTRDGRVDILVFELCLVVTIKAEGRSSSNKQFRIIRQMRIMACSAISGRNRGMLHFPAEPFLAMTRKTQVCTGCEKEPAGLCSLFVRLRMTGNTSPGLDYGMHHLACKLYLMAL